MKVSLDHVLLAAPAGCEAEARRFFGGPLGLAEVEKPEALRFRGGLWFSLGTQQLQIEVEEPFTPARKARPAFSVDRDNLDRLAPALSREGAKVEWDEDLEGTPRFHTEDPWGNRIEVMAAR